jgi:hypothetical protein
MGNKVLVGDDGYLVDVICAVATAATAAASAAAPVDHLKVMVRLL